MPSRPDRIVARLLVDMPADLDVYETVIAVLLQYREQQNTVGRAVPRKQVAVVVRRARGVIDVDVQAYRQQRLERLL